MDNLLIIMMKPNDPLMAKAHIVALGRTIPASRISSAVGTNISQTSCR